MSVLDSFSNQFFAIFSKSAASQVWFSEEACIDCWISIHVKSKLDPAQSRWRIFNGKVVTKRIVFGRTKGFVRRRKPPGQSVTQTCERSQIARTPFGIRRTPRTDERARRTSAGNFRSHGGKGKWKALQGNARPHSRRRRDQG